MITAGSERVFRDVHDPAKAIVIQPADERFARLVIEVPDPAETVSLIERNLTTA